MGPVRRCNPSPPPSPTAGGCGRTPTGWRGPGPSSSAPSRRAPPPPTTWAPRFAQARAVGTVFHPPPARTTECEGHRDFVKTRILAMYIQLLPGGFFKHDFIYIAFILWYFFSNAQFLCDPAFFPSLLPQRTSLRGCGRPQVPGGHNAAGSAEAWGLLGVFTQADPAVWGWGVGVGLLSRVARSHYGIRDSLQDTDPHTLTHPQPQPIHHPRRTTHPHPPPDGHPNNATIHRPPPAPLL